MRKLSLDAFTLKLIAIISMALSHTSVVFWEIVPIWLHIPLYAIRGITFPIMAFFLTEGFRRTSNIKRYMLRLLIFALIAQIPYMLVMEFFTLNIIFTILLGLICLLLHDKLCVKAQKRGLFAVIFAALLIGLLVTNLVEGGPLGPLMIFLFHVIKDEKKRRTIPLICWGAMMILSNFLTRVAVVFADAAVFADAQGPAMQVELLMIPFYVFSVGSFAVIPLLRAYNGERGRRAKFLFYAFYPAHLAVLAIAAYTLGFTDFPALNL